MAQPQNRTPYLTTSSTASAFLLLACIMFAEKDVRSDDVTSSKQVQYFEKYVRPLLADRCLECHSKDSDELGGNLQLDVRAGWNRGGDLGPAIVPGDPESSLLIQAVRHTHAELEMPPDGKLPDDEIRILVEWVRSGAADPRDNGQVVRKHNVDLENGRSYWAYQSPHGVPQPVPTVQDASWPTNEVDFFILAELERNRLRPAPSADNRTLIRRATFDLLGLPPTPDEIDAFLRDEDPDAYEKLIERLLDSPRYGERWGRFWLDVARYADSNGLDENIAHGNAWRYRDYVIDSFNTDKPFDQFVMEQLAGDLLPAADDEQTRIQRTIATGFLSLGPKVLAEVDETKMEMDIIDEQVETVGRAFMGLTMGCARCHDHKFDPITTEDYYALAGIFKSTKTMEHFTKIARWNEVDIATASERANHEAHLAKINETKARIEKLQVSANDASRLAKNASECNPTAGNQLESLQQELKRLEDNQPELAHAMAVADYDKATDLRVHVRGSFLSQADLVPRRFPVVLVAARVEQPPFGDSQSGRLQFAHWLVDGRHPLVARVMVNRIWRWHFGRGLVESTDNFGALGTPPQNQRLLDWLAVRFVDDGWSVKRMHHLIMLSSTYRMSAQTDDANVAIDEANQFHWRANVRRLEAEAIRDSILHVSGQLDDKMGGSLLHVKNREFLFDHTSKDKTKYDSVRRSVYLPVIRNHLYDAFQLFDYSDASVMNSNRTTTTVAPQALFMMNSELVTNSATAFAERICQDFQTDGDRITFAYKLAFGRPPTELQLQRANQFVGQFRRIESDDADQRNEDSLVPWRSFCQTLLMSNEFIHIR
ncbi:MAG: PSD1 domain-containing protein [Planctomycetales bacterium]|nr:PSD1 domain-containing protein [Planctomycetales bacterium]